jgi:hypothetical protein
MPFHRPYAADGANTIYNMAFADTPELFDQDGAWQPELFANELDEDAVRAIAEEENTEARVRLLAFNRLREEGREVPSRLVLGVIAEVPLEHGLDTLAAYADGRVRYINQDGGMVFIEEDVATLKPQVHALFAAAQALVDRIGLWTEERLPPPRTRRVRLTFLGSDGLYFGEGDIADLTRDELGGPVFNAAVQLLAGVVEFASGDDDAAAGQS